MQYSQSSATENFQQLRGKASRIEKGAKRGQQGQIASASSGYDRANPTFQGGFGEGPIKQ
jgi:hypothetical protein